MQNIDLLIPLLMMAGFFFAVAIALLRWSLRINTIIKRLDTMITLLERYQPSHSKIEDKF